MRLNETPNASGLGHLFFFFFFFSQSRGNAASQQFYGQFGWEKKKEKKDKNDSEQNYLPVSPRCCCCCSPRCLGHLAGVGVSARPQLHFPCPSRCSGHHAKASSVPTLGTTAPCTPAPRSAGTTCTRVFCALPPLTPALEADQGPDPAAGLRVGFKAPQPKRERLRGSVWCMGGHQTQSPKTHWPAW